MKTRSLLNDMFFAVLVVLAACSMGIVFNLSSAAGIDPFASYQGYGPAPLPTKDNPHPYPPVGLHSPISVEQALKVYGHALFVDARSKADFDQGHVPGAVNVPYSIMRLMPKEQGGGYSEEELELLKKACLVIVYDSGDGSAESLHADLKSVLPVFRVLDKGIRGWRQAGGPFWQRRE